MAKEKSEDKSQESKVKKILKKVTKDAGMKIGVLVAAYVILVSVITMASALSEYLSIGSGSEVSIISYISLMLSPFLYGIIAVSTAIPCICAIRHIVSKGNRKWLDYTFITSVFALSIGVLMVVIALIPVASGVSGIDELAPWIAMMAIAAAPSIIFLGCSIWSKVKLRKEKAS